MIHDYAPYLNHLPVSDTPGKVRRLPHPDSAAQR
jgi:hypothetical protein